MMPDETPYLQGSLFEEVQVQRLELHIRVAAEALARYVFDLGDSGLVSMEGEVECRCLRSR